ncbi:EamA family transporter [Actinoplanes sp. NPDC026619]|uniref:EamA family transporter n=1 Tax=Actinoplanes sp. NPDC026619 TaxID=3155798 RepID=UPI00340B4B3A
MTAALGAAAAWGISDFLAGVLGHRLPVLTILFGSELAAMALVLLALAARGELPAWDARLWLAVVAGLVGLPAMGLLYRAMRDGTPAVVAPVAAIGALVPVGWGLLHGERLGLATGLGVVAGLVGATMASWPVPGGERNRLRHSANLCALGAALGLGVFFVLLHEAGQADQLAALAVARTTEGVIALFLAMALNRFDRRLMGASIIVVGGLDVAADAAFIASATAALAPAAVVASLYPAVTLLLNRSFLRERLHAVHLCGVFAALVAVACLAR